ncbi:MAG TPA: metallophosphoesterase [Paludibacteraceae bacterium]|nr:metallophosphoesterase [Paludibacteraceae bacterium]
MKYGFFVVVFSIFAALFGYVGLRGWQSLALYPSARPVYLIVYLLLFACSMVGLIFGDSMPLPLSKIITFTGYSFLLVVAYLFLCFLLVDAVRLVNYLFHFAPGGMTTFRFWSMMSGLLIISVAMIIGNYKFNHPKIVHLELQSNKPLQKKEMKIVAASDIHLGNDIDKNYLKKYVRLINDQQPDIILLAGDICDRSLKPLIHQKMNEELENLKAPLGVYAIPGNHEYYTENFQKTLQFYESSGIKVLTDSVLLVNDSFYLAGRKDRMDKNRKKLSTLLSTFAADKPVILLDHQPSALNEAVQNNVDLQLSGHTHEGQVFPANLIVEWVFEAGYGYYKKGKTHLYVSSGLGLWGPPYRIGTQSEIVVVNFKY